MLLTYEAAMEFAETAPLTGADDSWDRSGFREFFVMEMACK
jgi:hypothetical protein